MSGKHFIDKKPESILDWVAIVCAGIAFYLLLNNLGYRIEEREDGFHFDGVRLYGVLSAGEMAALRDKVVEYLDFLMTQIERDVFQKQNSGEK